ncbi:MAG: sigma-70 family RNA polymerase sigma factor [Planctomycetes bacterium]|nr:sigma-70 family RNA polymerase sigma factor [Planctomycetota bacterium]
MHGADPERDSQGDLGARLMLAWKAGDESAFDRLVEAYSGQVWALLSRFVHAPGAREDLVQEVFLRVVRARDRYEPTARFSTWLYRIVFNLAVNETQRADKREVSRGSRRDDALVMGGLAQLADESVSEPAEDLARGDAVTAVRAAIRALPGQQRMALILAKYDELPYEEIGAVLGISEKAVKSLVHRARENLRERLAPFLKGELA